MANFIPSPLAIIVPDSLLDDENIAFDLDSYSIRSTPRSAISSQARSPQQFEVCNLEGLPDPIICSESIKKALAKIARMGGSDAPVLITGETGVEAIQSPNDVSAGILSLGYFLSASAHPALRVALENVNLFSVWYFILLATGLHLTARLSKLQSAFVVALLWAAQTGFLIILALIFVRLGAAQV